MQENGTNADIERYVKQHFNSKFPLFSKSEVNGKDTNIVFRFLRTHSLLYDPKTGMAKRISWNFAKFLVDGQGKVLRYFDPDDNLAEVRKAVEKLL
jgi:glutathione peroxidase